MRISDWSSDVCSSDLGFQNAAGVTSYRHPGEGRDLAGASSSEGEIPAFAGMTLLCGWGDLSQRLMDIADHHRPFADRRGDALHRSLAHIADGVDARPARFDPPGHTIAARTSAVSGKRGAEDG